MASQRTADLLPITVFKVVHEDEGKLLSAGAMGQAEVHYVPGEFAKPPFGLLFSFKDWPSALAYVANYDVYQVWRAITGGTLGAPEIVLNVPAGPLVEQYWKDEANGGWKPRKSWEWKKPENGTVMSYSLKLQERVW